MELIRVENVVLVLQKLMAKIQLVIRIAKHHVVLLLAIAATPVVIALVLDAQITENDNLFILDILWMHLNFCRYFNFCGYLKH